MSKVLAGVMEKVKAALPDQIGTNSRFDEGTVNNMIVAADRATRDLCEVHYAEQIINLADDTVSYDVAQTFISVNKVEFALDGTNYNWILKSKSVPDLDYLSWTWRTDRSTRPDFYSFLSAVGVQDNGDGVVPSQILLYPALGTAGSATIRLTGVGVAPVGAVAMVDMTEDVQTSCHVPYVMSLLFAVESPERAMAYWQKFIDGCERHRARFISQYKDNPGRS